MYPTPTTSKLQSLHNIHNSIILTSAFLGNTPGFSILIVLSEIQQLVESASSTVVYFGLHVESRHTPIVLDLIVGG